MDQVEMSTMDVGFCDVVPDIIAGKLATLQAGVVVVEVMSSMSGCWNEVND
jgi:hypothetical protein